MDDLPVVHQVALHADPEPGRAAAYERLWANPNWWTALENLAIFGILYIGLATAIGLLLAILLDQKIRGEGVLRTIYLYPMALSFIVTGTAWKWLLNPGIGIQKVVQDWGFTSFTLDWITQPNTAIYCIVIAAIWQSSSSSWPCSWPDCAASTARSSRRRRSTAPSTFNIYWRIIIPLMRPVSYRPSSSSRHLAIKSYDLVVALTDGGPGTATWLPAIFMYKMTFTRNEVALGAASSRDDADDRGRDHGPLPLFRLRQAGRSGHG